MGKKDVNGQMNEAEVAANEPAAEPAQAPSEAVASEASASEAAASEAAPVAEATGEAPPPAPAESVDPLEQLAGELRKTKDQLLRQAAEYQNFRRRTERERAEWSQRARIPVSDSSSAGPPVAASSQGPK